MADYLFSDWPGLNGIVVAFADAFYETAVDLPPPHNCVGTWPAGPRLVPVSEALSFGGYQFELSDLYARMWDIAAEDNADGTRTYAPRADGTQALKWLIHELAGTPADRDRSMSANQKLRSMAHEALERHGWARRLNNTSFELLHVPDSQAAPMQDAADMAAEELGTPIDHVAVADLVDVEDRFDLLNFEWSPWHSLDEAARSATTEPGVYVAATADEVVYVGMAGTRRGKGVRGRLQVYSRGRGAVSGLGEAALDRALADPAWLAQQLSGLLTTGPKRAKEWAQAAFAHANLRVCWTAAPDEKTARTWETEALAALEDTALWNRDRPRRESDRPK